MAKANKGGRPSISDAEKAKKGTLRKHRQHASETPPAVIALAALPEPPEWLGEHGVKEWRSKVDLLDRLKVLHQTDIGLLAMLCREWENYIAAEQIASQMNRHYTVKNPKSGEVSYIGIHPSHTIAQQHLKAYITLCNEFGFSPASRSRINMPMDEKIVSKAARLLKAAV